MVLDNIVPKKFLCYYPLNVGALWASALMICISIASSIAMLTQILMLDSCYGCPHYVWKNAYGFSVTAIVYSLIMLAIHIWLIYGVLRNKASIVLSWVVITSMWLALTFCLLIVLICMYSKETNPIAWILCLIFGLIAIGLLLYTILVVYGFWLQLKEKEKTRKMIIVSTAN